MYIVIKNSIASTAQKRRSLQKNNLEQMRRKGRLNWFSKVSDKGQSPFSNNLKRRVGTSGHEMCTPCYKNKIVVIDKIRKRDLCYEI